MVSLGCHFFAYDPTMGGDRFTGKHGDMPTLVQGDSQRHGAKKT